MTSSSEALEGIYHDMIGQQPTQANMPQEGIPTEEYMQKYGQVPTFNNVPTTTTQESDPNAWTQPGTSPAPQPSQDLFRRLKCALKRRRQARFHYTNQRQTRRQTLCTSQAAYFQV